MTENLDIDILVQQDISYDVQGGHEHIARPQLEHRINLVRNIWKIPQGSKVLEIGCGQGDCTLVLAAAVGQEGKVDAIDPCPPNYGSPWSVGEAQAHLKQGALGGQINFIRIDPISFLRTNTELYDHVVLNHCLWYFDSPDSISELLTILAPKNHARQILIAEWSLQARSLAQVPHVLAALTRGSREPHDPESTQNVRSPVSPAWFRRVFQTLGLQTDDQLLEPPAGMMDGQWEVMSILSTTFEPATAAVVKDERQLQALLSMRDAVKHAVGQLDDRVENVRSMLVWVAVI